MRKGILLIFTMLATLIGCGQYDDSELTSDINDLKSRMAALEKQCKNMNENLTSLQAIVDAIQKQDGNVAVAGAGRRCEDQPRQSPAACFRASTAAHRPHKTRPAVRAPRHNRRRALSRPFYHRTDTPLLCGCQGLLSHSKMRRVPAAHHP